MSITLLRRLIKETLLQERSTLPESVDLYHRSLKTFKVGDFIEGSFSSSYRNSSDAEIAMEQIRREKLERKWQEDWRIKNPPKGRGKKKVEIPAPPMPSEFDKGLSRIGSVFASLVPRSRFMNYGKLYRVRIVGDLYKIADSRLIDKIQEEAYSAARFQGFGDREISKESRIENVKHHIYYYAHKYFDEEVKITKYNLEDIEVYAPRMEVVEVVEEEGRVLSGNEYVSDKPLKINFNDYTMKQETINKIVDAGFEAQANGHHITIIIPAGEVIKFESIRKRDKQDLNADPKKAASNLFLSFKKIPGLIIKIYDSTEVTRIYKLAKSGVLKKAS
jgi:hypothetical protein